MAPEGDYRRAPRARSRGRARRRWSSRRARAARRRRSPDARGAPPYVPLPPSPPTRCPRGRQARSRGRACEARACSSRGMQAIGNGPHAVRRVGQAVDQQGAAASRARHLLAGAVEDRRKPRRRAATGGHVAIGKGGVGTDLPDGRRPAPAIPRTRRPRVPSSRRGEPPADVRRRAARGG